MRRLLLGALITLLVIGAAAGIGEWYARGRIVSGIAAEVEARTGTTPDVTLDSLPVLLDLARGTIDGITGTADVLAVETMTFEDVAVHATEIRTGSAPVIGSLTASAATASVQGMTFDDVTVQASEIDTEPLLFATLAAEALLPAGTVQALVQQQMDRQISVGFGDAAVIVTLEVLRQDLAITLVPEVTDGALTLAPSEVTLAGITLTLGDLPFGLSDLVHPIRVDLPIAPLMLDAVTITPEGARVQVSGTDVSPDSF